ncbi:MAG: hypothetical protein R2684_10565 [Pyrinomonadaceae bacterium]
MPNSIYKDLEGLSFEKVETYELKSRPSKVGISNFAAPIGNNASLEEFLDSMPAILAVNSIRELADRLGKAREDGKPIIWGFGGHVVKTGLAPIIIDLMDRGFVTALAVNGSVLVHDSEIAMVGFTSEDVDGSLGEGDFGAARETGELLNRGARLAAEDGIGLGEGVSRALIESGPSHTEASILCAAFNRRIPVTSHITIGADIGHFHPTADGGNLGAASHADFRLFSTLVGKMHGGGAYLNIGSAVTMPELFLKAITVNRNLGNPLREITTANFDFIQHYRPLTNVVRRPTANGAGKGFSLVGHHEIMIPLLASLLVTRGG